MACGATLKRSLDFDPLHSPGQTTPKRRRCAPMNLSPSTPPRHAQPSPFGDVNPKLTSEQIAANLTMEIRRLQKRKQLHFPHSSSNLSPPNSPSQSTSTDNVASPSAMDSSSVQSLVQCSSNSLFTALSPNKRDIPLFTFKQVSMICERMLKERESQIREQYNSVLTCKMAEQYEAFLKFNHDQIQKRFSSDTVASYVS
ncbi:akirin-2-like [Ruditapes philippinarum]|uniref:akirin-2-like n=1 Tax=Ruditapes philippinarum TaxID=129788 RepID=UPI00295C2682|nr:akirin-2-like [Ruditapes philippinarum]